MVGIEIAKPHWLRVKAPANDAFAVTRGILTRRNVVSVCDSSQCPNISECWSRGRATFMVLGNECTRSCPFCAVASGRPDGRIDVHEPERVASAVNDLDLEHVVITSVTRDDLDDHGAEHFANVVAAIRRRSPGTSIELLIPDMRCSRRDLETIIASAPDVLGHNIETVRRLQSQVRDRKASYDSSLAVLRIISQHRNGGMIKSSLLLGFGESREEVSDTLRDLRGAGVELLAIGQYLRPKGGKLDVAEYIDPTVFDGIKNEAMKLGFSAVAAAPFVRSSFNAMETFTIGSGGKNQDAHR